MFQLFALLTLLPFSQNALSDDGHAHLAFENGLHAHLSWVKAPVGRGEESQMRLDWYDGSTHNRVEPGLPFEVVLWMPSMGHGSAPTKIDPVANDQGQAVPGAYLVSRMYFVMPGDWDIRVNLTHRNGRKETKAWSIMLGGGHGGHH